MDTIVLGITTFEMALTRVVYIKYKNNFQNVKRNDFTHS